MDLALILDYGNVLTLPQALFVDDRPENVAAAANLGMRTVHFTGEDSAAHLRAALARPR